MGIGNEEYPLVYRNGRLVPKAKAGPKNSGPYIQSDNMGQALEHHAYDDGRRTDSKSQFRQWTKDAGCVELGNDRVNTAPRQADIVQRDVIKSIDMLRQGYKPGTVR